MTGNDVYFNPEMFGLTIIEEWDYSCGYEFDLRVIWMDEGGALYTMRDRGCSCPSPFDQFNKKELLCGVNYGELLAEVDYETGQDDYEGDEKIEIISKLEKIKKLLNKKEKKK